MKKHNKLILTARGALEVIDVVELPEPEKVVIPHFVADVIEEYKSRGGSLLTFAHLYLGDDFCLSEEADAWLQSERHSHEQFAQAWVNGYELEKEQLYYVINKNRKLLLVAIPDDKGIVRIEETDIDIDHVPSITLYQLTEKEIRDYDENYMVFAKGIEEVEA